MSLSNNFSFTSKVHVNAICNGNFYSAARVADNILWPRYDPVNQAMWDFDGTDDSGVTGVGSAASGIYATDANFFNNIIYPVSNLKPRCKL